MAQPGDPRGHRRKCAALISRHAERDSRSIAVCIEQNLLQRERVAPGCFPAHREQVRADQARRRRPRTSSGWPSPKRTRTNSGKPTRCTDPVRHGGAAVADQAHRSSSTTRAASCCHGQFFLAETTETLIGALRSALYKRGVPDAMYLWTTAASTPSKRSLKSAGGSARAAHHHPRARRRGKRQGGEILPHGAHELLRRRSRPVEPLGALNQDFIGAWVEDEYNGPRARLARRTPHRPFRPGFKPGSAFCHRARGQRRWLFFVEEDRKRARR